MASVGCSSGISSPPTRCSAVDTRRQQAPSRHSPPDQQLDLPFEPSTLAQRLAQALGPEHLLLRFRTYREYPTEEQARWRIIELLEVGFRPRRVAKLLAIQPAVVYHWKRRFARLRTAGLDHPHAGEAPRSPPMCRFR